jgi:hypothetical protein
MKKPSDWILFPFTTEWLTLVHLELRKPLRIFQNKFAMGFWGNQESGERRVISNGENL